MVSRRSSICLTIIFLPCIVFISPSGARNLSPETKELLRNIVNELERESDQLDQNEQNELAREDYERKLEEYRELKREGYQLDQNELDQEDYERNMQEEYRGERSRPGCINEGECNGLIDGNYQYCKSCFKYITCWGGATQHSIRDCALNLAHHPPDQYDYLVWDDHLGTCEYTSQTCHPNTREDTILHVTCDNILTVYYDGVKQSIPVNEANDWTKTSSIDLPGSVQVVGIECVDLHVIAGILASTDDNLVTDDSWECSPTSARDWSSPDFQGSWPAATVIAQYLNPDWPWGNRNLADISRDAYWIWTPYYWSSRGDRHVFCRRDLSK